MSRLQKNKRRPAWTVPAWLGRYRLEATVVLAMAVVVALLVLYVPAREQGQAAQAADAEPTVALRPTSTAIPQAVGSTAMPPYVAPRLTTDEAVKVVSALPSNRTPGMTLADTVVSQWTAEYRGDGTWMVRAGEPAWLLLEDSRAAMPANIAAINLQGADARPAVR